VYRSRRTVKGISLNLTPSPGGRKVGEGGVVFHGVDSADYCRWNRQRGCWSEIRRKYVQPANMFPIAYFHQSIAWTTDLFSRGLFVSPRSCLQCNASRSMSKIHSKRRETSVSRKELLEKTVGKSRGISWKLEAGGRLFFRYHPEFMTGTSGTTRSFSSARLIDGVFWMRNERGTFESFRVLVDARGPHSTETLPLPLCAWNGLCRAQHSYCCVMSDYDFDKFSNGEHQLRPLATGWEYYSAHCRYDWNHSKTV